MPDLDTQALIALRELAGKAVTGPWRPFFATDEDDGWVLYEERAGIKSCFAGGLSKDDAAYIAKLDPQTITSLVNQALRARELEAVLTDAAKELAEAADKFWVIHCNHPGDRCGRGQAEDKAFLAVMHKRMDVAEARARAPLSPKMEETTNG